MVEVHEQSMQDIDLRLFADGHASMVLRHFAT